MQTQIKKKKEKKNIFTYMPHPLYKYARCALHPWSTGV